MRADFTAFKEQVRSRVDIVEVIGADVDLKPCGHVLKGLSPFHQETHPSFVVWPRTQSWHDFSHGGGLGGDVFAYVQERDKVGFKEALFALAKRAGVRRPDQDEGAWKQELAELSERRTIRRLLTAAAAYYHRVLPSKIRAQLYREHYGFSDETIDDLRLGWADGNLFGHLTETLGVPPAQACKTGLFVVLRNDRAVDFFQSRLVFPYWKGGQVVYFIARATEHTPDEQWEKAKYKKLLTRSDRHLYVSPAVRNDTFYNEDAARGAEELLVTEGVTDCISARQAGVACISPVTTRFRTRDVPRLLELTRRARRIVICNDAEDSGAGEAGARETVAALWAARRPAHLAALKRPEGKDKIDVNELVTTAGPEALAMVMAEARPYPLYLLDTVQAEPGQQGLDAALEPLFEAICAAPQLDRDAYLDAIVKRFGLGKRAVNAKLREVSDRLKRAASKKACTSGRLPVIQINGRQLRDVFADARAALVSANRGRLSTRASATAAEEHDSALLFRRAGRVVSLCIEEDMAPLLSEVTDTRMFSLLSRDADFVSLGGDGMVFPASPPKDLARDMVTLPPRGFPKIDAVITTPVFGRGGELLLAPGLHAGERLWHQRDPNLQVAPVPAEPTPQDVARARALLLDDLLVDFPFSEDADRAHALAAILLPFVRRLVAGNTPLHVVEAPSIGSGKSLLCHLVSIVCTGSPAAVSTLPGDEEEVRKTITAQVIRAGPMVVFDNAKERKRIDSQALASLLTTPNWESRILGRSEVVQVPTYAMWMLTGNNLRLSSELLRRSVHIRIDPKQDRAWQRSGFRHDPIMVWAAENRSKLVHAVLVLVQAWIAAGRPVPDMVRLGSFEGWTRVLGGILQVAGVPGFLANIDKNQADNDEEGEAWRAFVAAWWEEHQDQAVSASQLRELCEKHELMLDLLGDGSERSQQCRLGRALKGARDRVFGELRLELDRNNRTKANFYRLIRQPAEKPKNIESQHKEVDPWSDDD